MQKIVPHLWFDTQAVEAANWYVSIFEHSRILRVSSLEGTPSGHVDTVEFELDGVAFSAISAGPYFEFNASVSLMVTCRSPEEVDRLYASLSQGATELMPLGEYPFSKRYAWLADRYGSLEPGLMASIIALVLGGLIALLQPDTTGDDRR